MIAPVGIEMHRNGCISLWFVKSFVGLRYALVRHA
jgi:hypothetical protein